MCSNQSTTDTVSIVLILQSKSSIYFRDNIKIQITFTIGIMVINIVQKTQINLYLQQSALQKSCHIIPLKGAVGNSIVAVQYKLLVQRLAA